MRELDSIDRHILAVLQANARLPISALGEQVGLSASACSRRVAQLERDGCIEGYCATLNPSLLAMDMVAIVLVTLQSQSESCLAKFERAINRCRQVISCDLMSGSVDYSVRIAVRDLKDYERLHREVLSVLPGVTRIESNFVLRGVINRRQPVLKP